MPTTALHASTLEPLTRPLSPDLTAEERALVRDSRALVHEHDLAQQQAADAHQALEAACEAGLRGEELERAQAEVAAAHARAKRLADLLFEGL